MPKLRVIIKPPPEPQGEPEQQVEALRDYLLQMSEELAYVLTHLEADNINDSTFERIQRMIPRPYTGLPVMDGDANPGQSEQWARGNHRHPQDTSKADVTALEAEAAAREAHEADTDNPHGVTAAQARAIPDTATLDDISNGTTYAKTTAVQVAQIGTNEADIDTIEEKIPSAASTSNQLADKAFVTDSITQGTAIFRGSFATKAALLAVAWQTTDPNAPYYVSNNDYAVVLDDETQSDECWRYIYVTGTGWTPQYRINETPMTQAQLDALNSGATAAIISSVADKLDKTGDGKDVTATFTAASTRANIGTGEKLSVLFGKISKWFADLGTAAFRAATGSITSGSTDLVESGAVYSGLVGKAPTFHASVGSNYGTGNSVSYGHVKLYDGVDSTSGVSSGIAATPAAVKNAYDLANGKYSKPSGGIPASDLAIGVIPTVPSASTANPQMDGTASPGGSGAWARGDHVHPSDTSKQDTLTFDNLPQQWSDNPVKSSGIYSSLAGKADQEQLAPREIGTVTSQNYERGDYFYWVPLDMLLRVTTAIAAGATIDVGTNCEEAQFGRELNKRPEYGMLAPVESSGTASRAYTYGERFIYQGTLYQAISTIAVNGAITPGTNCQTVGSMEARWQTYSYSANGTYTITLQRNSRRYLVLADRLGRAAVLMAYITYNGNTPQLITLADIDAANRGISLSISGATLTVTVSQTYAIVKIMEV